MGKYEMYAIVYHIERESSRVRCESARCEGRTKKEVKEKLSAWLESRTDLCEIPNCECRDSGIIVKEITPTMIMDGATENIIEIK